LTRAPGAVIQPALLLLTGSAIRSTSFLTHYCDWPRLLVKRCLPRSHFLRPGRHRPGVSNRFEQVLSGRVARAQHVPLARRPPWSSAREPRVAISPAVRRRLFASSGGSNIAATGINDAGQVVGVYDASSAPHGAGFLLSPGGMYTTISVPISNSTFASGINNAGQIAGNYGIPVGQGFIRSTDGSTYTTIDIPSSTEGTSAHGINAVGQIVGNYVIGSNSYGCLRSADGSTYTTFSDPLGIGTTNPSGINAAGLVVGNYVGSGEYHGFLRSVDGRRSRSGGCTWRSSGWKPARNVRTIGTSPAPRSGPAAGSRRFWGSRLPRRPRTSCPWRLLPANRSSASGTGRQADACRRTGPAFIRARLPARQGRTQRPSRRPVGQLTPGLSSLPTPSHYSHNSRNALRPSILRIVRISRATFHSAGPA
jgi:hypothetical protein